jgi:hypothetical protein
VLIRRTTQGATALGISRGIMSAWGTLPVVGVGWPTPDHLLMRMPALVPGLNGVSEDCMT